MTGREIDELRDIAARASAADGFTSDRALKLAGGVTALLDERKKLVGVLGQALLNADGPAPLTRLELAEYLLEALDTVAPDRR